MEYFAKLGTRHIGLFTLANSPKHVGLYQRFGFWPHFLTAIMFKQLVDHDEKKTSLQWSKYSELQTAEGRHSLTNFIYDGLDVQSEINSVNTQSLGDTVLLWQKDKCDGLHDAEQRRKRLVGLVKNAKIIDKGFKAALQEGVKQGQQMDRNCSDVFPLSNIEITICITS